MTKMIGTIITRPASKNSGRPMSSATTHHPRQRTRGRVREDRRHEPVGGARFGHQRTEHRAQRNDDADVAEQRAGAFAERARDCFERQAVKPAAKVPTIIDRNGASFSTLMKMMISASPSAHDRISWVSGRPTVSVLSLQARRLFSSLRLQSTDAAASWWSRALVLLVDSSGRG
ncbi:hypothetical protein OKW27_001650 [Paraburkholderia sp. 35.1]